jgi:hypothetical protein
MQVKHMVYLLRIATDQATALLFLLVAFVLCDRSRSTSGTHTTHKSHTGCVFFVTTIVRQTRTCDRENGDFKKMTTRKPLYYICMVCAYLSHVVSYDKK